jgi:predicted nucleic acid-binding protein
MNRFLLDTNVLSELRKVRPHGSVVAWLSDQEQHQLFVSAVSVGEIQRGIERTRHQDEGKAAEIQDWLERLIVSSQVLPMDAYCFREWARLMERVPEELLEDAMIAATARVHGLVVATRNERDFRNFDVQVVNPFKTS